MRISYYIVGLLSLALTTSSCQRENPIVEPYVPQKGGEGGKTLINVTPQHHKININDGKVCIKYGAKEMPTGEFDDTVALSFSLGRPAASFGGLTQGDYYIYAWGVDTELEPGKDMVKGGAHFRVIDTLENTYDLYLQLDNHEHHEK